MLEKLPALLWLLAWTSGGLLLAASAFRLPRRLIFGAGLALGARTHCLNRPLSIYPKVVWDKWLQSFPLPL
ncbi:MAG: hypothetical protein B6D40_07430 [Anaerolineae bacterium UTCFX3]|jgi:hypothetical protein|nr:MAG: hypothetical protein B6D40_07430 [Anaerolineae bacterium UTCFX3]